MLALLAWRKAWGEGDFIGYLVRYDGSFKGDQASRSAWEKQRRERLENRRIEIHLDDMRVRVSDGTARAEFTQRYVSDKFEDLGQKIMEFRKVGGKWLIVSEQWRKP